MGAMSFCPRRGSTGMRPIDTHGRPQETADIAAAQRGGEPAFARLVERHRPELLVHCYRMLGSFDEAEDAVQETFLRAWRKRASFSLEGRWSYRAWPYRITTNLCLNVLARAPRRVLQARLAPASETTVASVNSALQRARANRQPAAACYVRRPGQPDYHAFCIDVLRVGHGEIAEVISFTPRLFPAFGLPWTVR